MGIVQQAIAKLIAPSLQPLADKVAELELKPAFTAEDKAALDKASAVVAELEALAGAAADPVVLTGV